MKKILLMLCVAVMALNASGQDCDLHIQVITPDTGMCGGDSAIGSLLSTRLMKALTSNGVTADDNYGQLYLSGKFDDIYKETLAGPPAQTAVHTSLTLMVADIFGNKTFDSETFDLRGVGTSPQRAYINALGSLNAKNKKLEEFINRAKRKVISYFDNNYASLLAKAKTAATRHDYDQALYFASLIPQCCKGYPQAERALLEYHQQYLNFEGTRLLNQAKAAFALSPNSEGAAEAYALLNNIDPSSSAYNPAMSFASEVKKQTKAEYDFEVHQKYTDEHQTRLKKIDAARQIGVAFGQGQKQTTTNILWK